MESTKLLQEFLKLLDDDNVSEEYFLKWIYNDFAMKARAAVYDDTVDVEDW